MNIKNITLNRLYFNQNKEYVQICTESQIDNKKKPNYKSNFYLPLISNNDYPTKHGKEDRTIEKKEEIMRQMK